MKKKIIEFLSFLSISFLLILMMNSSIKATYGSISFSDYSMYLYINGGIGLLLYIASKIKNFKFSKYEIMVFIMALLSCLSLINCVDINTAIFGTVNRYEGLLVWLTYYILLLNAMNIKNKKYLYGIISLISIYMLINIIYGLFQIGLLNKPSFLNIALPWHYARGFLGNSMFFGSLACIFYGIVLGIFIKVKIGLKKYLLAIVLLLANLAIIMNGSMSAVLTVIVINFVCLIQIIIQIIKKKENAFIFLGSIIIAIMSSILVFSTYAMINETVKNDILQFFGQTKSVVVDNDINDNYGTGRIYIWRKTIEKIKEAPITGFGIDNFRKAFDDKLLFKNTLIVDKAHNDYLQKALCEGIISGVVFIVFLLTIFFKGIFRNLSPVYYGLLLAFTCYSIQAFFNISVTSVAPIYFIIIGLLINVLESKKKGNLDRKESII